MTPRRSPGANTASPIRSSPTGRWRSAPPSKPDSLHLRCSGRCLKYGAHTYHEPAVVADRPPFEDLYRAYLRRIHAYVRAQAGSPPDAEDITAQGFLNAYPPYARYETRHTTPA